MKYKIGLIVFLSAAILTSCGQSNQTEQQQVALTSEKAGSIISDWLAEKTEASEVIDGTSRKIIKQSLKSLNKLSTDKAYPYISHDVKVNDIKHEGGSYIIDAVVLERKGYGPNEIEEGGNLHYIFDISYANSKYSINEVAEEAFSGSFITTKQIAENLMKKDVKQVVEQGFEQEDAPRLNPQRIGYSGLNARNYARQYALNYNPNYRVEGNDCTNFISQALLAGGWTQKGWALWDRARDDLWFYKNPWSYTWGGAANWPKFAASTQRTSIAGSISGLGLGDVVQIDLDGNRTMDHSMVVTQTPSTAGQYKFSYHTGDYLDRAWTEIASKYPASSFAYHDVLYSSE